MIGHFRSFRHRIYGIRMEGKTDVSYYLIVSASLTQAQKSSRALERAGIPAGVSRLPRKLSAEGCGFGVKIPESALPSAIKALDGAGISHNRVFLLTENGGVREVPL